MTWNLEEQLLALGAVKLNPLNPFQWSSGLKAPIYCDHRNLLGYPESRNQIALGLGHLASQFNPSLIAGTSTAGIPWGVLVAHQLSLPFVYVRPEPKSHGLGRQVEGISCKEQNIVLIEDLVSTGGSSLRCVEALRREGGQVLSVVAIFNYGLPASQMAFENEKVILKTLGNLENLLKKAMGTFSPEALASLQSWQQDPQAWSARQG